MGTENPTSDPGQKFEEESAELVLNLGRLFTEQLVDDYSLNIREQIRVVSHLNAVVEGYRDFGIAESIHAVLMAVGGVYSEDMPDPRPEQEAKAKKAALKLIGELRDMDFSTENINEITPNMKKLVEAATLYGKTVGFNMTDNPERYK